MPSDIYAGEPTHLRWSGAILTITKSDASDEPRYHKSIEEPSFDEEGGWKKFEEADEETEKLWLGKTANYLVYESRMLISKDRVKYLMSNFPKGYRLYTHYSKRVQDEEVRTDSYLMGSTTKGCTKFRSPEEFALHAKWLAYGCPKGQCQCRYCSKTKQGDISKNLKKVTSFIRDWSFTQVASTSRDPLRIRNPSVPSSAGSTHKVMAKDYTHIKDGQYKIWVEE